MIPLATHRLRLLNLYRQQLRWKPGKSKNDRSSGGREDVLARDITELLSSRSIPTNSAEISWSLDRIFSAWQNYEEVVVSDVEVLAQTLDGDGLAIIPRNYVGTLKELPEDQKRQIKKGKKNVQNFDIEDSLTKIHCDDSKHTVVVIPKTVPGDVVEVALRRHHSTNHYAEGSLIRVTGSTSRGFRDDNLVKCRYFEKCLGCQLQMMPYPKQLAFKRDVIRRAYKYNYPNLNISSFANFGEVVGSPLQSGYRTKLTPHAKIPRNGNNFRSPWPIGFKDVNNASKIVDIEQCTIASEIINKALPSVREDFHTRLEDHLQSTAKSKLSPTLLLRDSIIDLKTPTQRKCTTGHKEIVTEVIGDKTFQFHANEFFQVNKSILLTFIDFLGQKISDFDGQFRYIVDSYCGCGFLGIHLSDKVAENGYVFGIEISQLSIVAAKKNAELNGLTDRVVFVLGNSDDMFTHPAFVEADLTGPQSVLLMNPSRSGSTKTFLNQVLEFKPRMIIYVSCNVFTQARDLNDLENLLQNKEVQYELKSVTGFDFYPQTKHVESVALLHMKER